MRRASCRRSTPHRGARAGACACEIALLQPRRDRLVEDPHAARPRAERHEFAAERLDSLVLADAADRRMPVEHLLEERGARAGESDHERDAVERLRARRDPPRAGGDLGGLLARPLQEPLEIEAGSRVRMHARGEVERLAVAACLVEQADRLEAGRSPQHRAAGRGRDRRERLDRLRRLAPCKRARLHQRSARIARPRAARLEEPVELVAPMREPVDLREGDRRLERLWCARRRDTAQSIDGALDPAEPLLDHALQQVCLRIVGGELQRRVEVGVGFDELPEVQIGASAAKPRGETATGLGDHRVGRLHGAREVAVREQALEFGWSWRAGGHGVVGERRAVGGRIRAVREVGARKSAPPPQGRGGVGFRNARASISRSRRRNGRGECRGRRRSRCRRRSGRRTADWGFPTSRAGC